jgi:hypothetical protein
VIYGNIFNYCRCRQRHCNFRLLRYRHIDDGLFKSADLPGNLAISLEILALTMSRIQQNFLIARLDSEDQFREQFYTDSHIEPDYNPFPIRNPTMKRSFHLDCLNGKLDVTECSDDTQVKLSLNDSEVLLDFDAFNELCSLKYTLNLNQRSF